MGSEIDMKLFNNIGNSFRKYRYRVQRNIINFFEQREFLRIITLVLLIWLIGTTLLFFLERHENSDFDSLPKAFWNIAVYLFSGLDSGEPTTVGGQITATIVLVLSAGLVAIFTAQIASFFIERKLRGRMNLPSKYKLRDHIVICNWNELVIPLIEQLHAEVVDFKRPIVIISQDDNAGNFPDKYSGLYEDVFVIKGDPTKEDVLNRASTVNAYSVIVLADRKLGELGDAKSILICLAIRSIESKAEEDIHIHICVEGADLRHVEHLEKAKADEIICSEDFSMGLLAQSTLSHNLSTIYKNLVTNSEDTNEFYQIEIPDKFLKYTFTELGKYIYENRDADNPFLLVGINKAGKPILNPKPGEVINIEAEDRAIVIAWKKPKLV